VASDLDTPGARLYGEARPKPPIPETVDLRSYPRILIGLAWLLDSEFAIRSSPGAYKALIRLLGASWRQVPAGSLPSDERLLSYWAGLAPDAWSAIREELLGELVLCDDGRLYHGRHAEDVMEAWARLTANRRRTKAATAARASKRKTSRRP